MKNRKGFTITELVIVIAVIAILAAVLIPTFSNIIDKANKNAALQEARNVYTQHVADNAAAGTAKTDAWIQVDDYYVQVVNGALVASSVTKTAPAQGTEIIVAPAEAADSSATPSNP